MPTLDDLSTLDTNAAVAANDLIAISDSSASGRGGSKVRKLPAALATFGFSHAFRIDYDSASAAKAATGSGEVNLLSLVEGSIVTDCAVMVSSNFDGPAISSYLIDVGVTADPNGFVAAFEMENSTALLTKNTGGKLDDEEETGGHVVGSSQSLSFTLTAVGANLDTATAGSCIILANILVPADFATLVPVFD